MTWGSALVMICLMSCLIKKEDERDLSQAQNRPWHAGHPLQAPELQRFADVAAGEEQVHGALMCAA